MLSFSGTISHRSSFFGRGDGVVLLSSVGCTGTEARLIDCVVGSSIPSYCSLHYYDAGVTCIGKSDSPTSSITLTYRINLT